MRVIVGKTRKLRKCRRRLFGAGTKPAGTGSDSAGAAENTDETGGANGAARGAAMADSAGLRHVRRDGGAAGGLSGNRGRGKKSGEKVRAVDSTHAVGKPQ